MARYSSKDTSVLPTVVASARLLFSQVPTHLWHTPLLVAWRLFLPAKHQWMGRSQARHTLYVHVLLDRVSVRAFKRDLYYVCTCTTGHQSQSGLPNQIYHVCTCTTGHLSQSGLPNHIYTMCVHVLLDTTLSQGCQTWFTMCVHVMLDISVNQCCKPDLLWVFYQF